MAAFGKDFIVTLDEVEDYFGEIQEVLGEPLSPGEERQADDIVIGTCRL